MGSGADPQRKNPIDRGELDIDDAPGTHDKGGCTVWFKEKISGPVRITYDATMVQKGVRTTESAI